LGAEHRFNEMFAVFGHVAHAFRVPNADERIGLGTVTNFDLRTQTSSEIEGGARLHLGRFKAQSSIYDMELKDEIFFSPATFTNVNLDPTRHWGVETTASLQLSDTVSLHGNVTYTRATFREGAFAGNDIPLISRWTANAGLTWDIWRKFVVYDLMLHYAGERRLDNDSANTQPLIPAHTVVDMRIGGQLPVGGPVMNAFWSFTVQNVFNEMYYDYGVASTATIGRFNAYPQPGRTFMFRAGFDFGAEPQGTLAAKG
jgi:iron complex outermembrane receptor protein